MKHRETSQATSSRIAGFYRKPLGARRDIIAERVSEDSRAHLRGGGQLDLGIADLMSENVVAVHGLPLSVALNFRVNRRDHVVPMAVEEPSIVAAASNAARLVRLSGGFAAEADEPVMTAQVQLDAVPRPEAAAHIVADHKDKLMALADRAIPSMVARGGGCRDIDVRVVDAGEGMVVTHFYIDVRDAMGANVADSVAEKLAWHLAELLGGRIGLRILTNLPVRRMVRVQCWVSDEALGARGAELAAGICRASRFAERDVFRAATHNKGIMNGIDAAAVALGQDWRAIEAGAHAYAALHGTYRPLAVWHRDGAGVCGELEMPLALGTVGGACNVHPGVQAALEIIGTQEARTLATVVASVGLASNLAALKALVGEGIQQGHMKLHHRKRSVAPGEITHVR